MWEVCNQRILNLFNRYNGGGYDLTVRVGDRRLAIDPSVLPRSSLELPVSQISPQALPVLPPCPPAWTLCTPDRTTRITPLDVPLLFRSLDDPLWFETLTFVWVLQTAGGIYAGVREVAGAFGLGAVMALSPPLTLCSHVTTTYPDIAQDRWNF